MQKKRTRRIISSHLDGASLVNKGFIVCPIKYTSAEILAEDSGQSQEGKLGPPSLLG